MAVGAPTRGHSEQGTAARLEDARRVTREYAGLVREHFGERVRNVWLYGSAARGDWTPESDIDVLVVLKNEQAGDIEWLVQTAYRVGLVERHLLLQPVMLTAAAAYGLVALAGTRLGTTA